MAFGQVFDKPPIPLQLLAYMRTNAQWSVQAGDDVMVELVRAVAVMALENTLVNQKLITSLLPTDIGHQVPFVRRSMSTVVSLTDAHTASLPFATNLDLRFGGSGIQLFD